jgi:hypothetical protein
MRVVIRLMGAPEVAGIDYEPNTFASHLTALPRKGETLKGPDDIGRFRVVHVIWDFEGGFEGRAPTVYIYGEKLPADEQ